MQVRIYTGLVLGQALALLIAGWALARHGWNAARSYAFVTNGVFLATFYWPLMVTGAPDAEVVTVLLLGHAGVNLGILAAHIVDELLFHRIRPDVLGTVLRLPSQRYLTGWFAGGIAAYGLLYVMRGVPLLAADVSVARAEFAAGSGPLTWPAMIGINTAIWAAVIRRHYRAALLMGVTGISFLLLSGWRGPLLVAALTALFIASHQGRVNKRGILVGLATLLALGLLGALRAVLAGEGESAAEPSDGLVAGAALAGVLSVVLRFSEQAFNFSVAVDHFAANHLGGRAILMDLSFLLPGPNLTLENYMREEFALWTGGGGMPVTMIGAFYADFGRAGALVGCAAAGFAIVAATALLKRAAVSNEVFLLPVGFLATFWIYGILGSFFGNLVPFALVYSIGTLGIVGLYSSNAAQALAASRGREAWV